MEDEITQRIQGVLSELRTLHIDTAELDDDQDLYAAGLRSIAAVQLMLALEDEFDIEFLDSELHRSAFATIARIRTLIEDHIAVAGVQSV
jgi:acyl carrier protein